MTARRSLQGLAMLALMLPAPLLAGDASGFDPAAIDQCLAEGGDCAEAGMEACLDYAQQKYTGDDPDFPQANCLDASHQAWEAKLTEAYQGLLDRQQPLGVKPQEMLRQTEHSWIAFRDDLCNWSRDAAEARGENAELAALRCRRDEAARHWHLLSGLAGTGEE